MQTRQIQRQFAKAFFFILTQCKPALGLFFRLSRHQDQNSTYSLVRSVASHDLSLVG